MLSRIVLPLVLHAEVMVGGREGENSIVGLLKTVRVCVCLKQFKKKERIKD